MKIYISGISGTGMGPLALFAKDAGIDVVGSDLSEGAVLSELIERGIPVKIGPQDGTFLEEQADAEWFIYTSALPAEHPELVLAKKMGLKISKRDDFINFLIREFGLKLVAISGTHGKTTTTAMIIWAAEQLNLPITYLVGTTLAFAPSGHYQKGAEYLVYEADEYDRNFLSFHPWLGIVTVATYDHPDIYPTEEDYRQAFLQFERQSGQTLRGGEIHDGFTLPGPARREDATTALKALSIMFPKTPEAEIIAALDAFPGVGRRFEKLRDGLYTDYAHHPEEISATLKIANEEATRSGKKGVVAIYEPHQNTRQQQLKEGYKNVFKDADVLYWLPTYLTREDESLAVLTPKDFLEMVTEPAEKYAAKLDEEMLSKIQQYLQSGYLVILMTAGPADTWLRKNML